MGEKTGMRRRSVHGMKHLLPKQKEKEKKKKEEGECTRAYQIPSKGMAFWVTEPDSHTCLSIGAKHKEGWERTLTPHRRLCLKGGF